MDTTLADPLLGVVLDRRYRVDAVLAHGGMSTVYAGSDLRLDRPVAIKVMSPSFSVDPAFVRQFGTEARSAARLSHPNVVSVHDQGTDAEHVFLVMELVRGRTLRQLLRERGAVAPELAVSLLEPVLAALAAAHRAGLVHRDVKPENVLLADDGVVKVADFGLARAVASATTTQTSSVMGTIAYVAPEQVSRGATDARTDVYSAGIMLYEMLVGTPPYRADTVLSVAYQHVHEDVPAPSAAHPGVPPELDALVLSATRRDPASRPVDADAFLTGLRSVRAALALPRVPIPARPSTNTVGVDPTQAGQSAEAGQAVQGGPSNPGLNRTRALRFPMTPPLPRVRPLPVAGPDEPPASRAGVPSYPNRPDHRDHRDHTSHPEYPDYHAERRVRRRRGVIVLVAVLLLGAGAAGAGWSYGILHYTKVPVLKGMTRGAAVGIAHESHLRVRSTTSAVFDDTVKAGLVAGSSPGQGNRITRGGELTLLISKGPGPRTIPNLSGRSADEALRTLADLKLTGKVAPVFGDVDAGSVAATAPRSGSTVAIGSTVTVLVSKGRLPDTTGDTRDNAVRQLRDAGLKVRVTEEFTDEAARGKVASQQPSGGIVGPGATVTLVVSKGAESVRVPNVIGKDLDDARAQLEKLGFKVKVNLVLGGRSGRVVTQTPIGGFSQHRGAIIHLGVI